jgi:Fur family peroxide stress response transcriptional regulator
MMKNSIEKLRERGVVLTHQRLAVLRFILEHPHSHPTAAEIYRHLRQKYPTISQATVYSTLELLRKVGQIRELSIRGNQSCYDTAEVPHYHLFCRGCRRVLDVDAPCPSLESETLQGHRIDEVELYLYGMCSDCLKGDGGPGPIDSGS